MRGRREDEYLRILDHPTCVDDRDDNMRPSVTSTAGHRLSPRIPRTTSGAAVAAKRARFDWRHPDLLFVAVVLSVGALLAIASHEWGANTHSLISLGVTALLLWHVMTRWRWIRGVAKNPVAHPQRALISTNAALAFCLALVTVSGILVWFWDMPASVHVLHGVSSVLFLVLATVHAAFKGKRLARRLRRSRRVASALA